MQIAQVAQRRYTTKAFDPSRQISADDLAAIRTLLRNAASSVNSQPWHFVIASSEAGKGAIAETLKTGYAYNEGKVRNASQVVVFCARKTLDAAHLNAVLAQEEADGRFATPEAKATQEKTRQHYVALHQEMLGDVDAWVDARSTWPWARCCLVPVPCRSTPARSRVLIRRRLMRRWGWKPRACAAW